MSLQMLLPVACMALLAGCRVVWAQQPADPDSGFAEAQGMARRGDRTGMPA